MKPLMKSSIAMLPAAICVLLLLDLSADDGRADPKQDAKAAAKQAQVDAQKAAEQAQRDAQAEQFAQQMRPNLLTELSFVRQMCDLKPAQRPKIKAAAEAGLKLAAKQYTERNFRRRGAVIGAFVGNMPDAADPRQTIYDALIKEMRDTLTPEQMAHYTDEHAKREANRKRAAVLSMVAQLDSALLLTGEQREEITAEISRKWQPKWENWLRMQSSNQYFPPGIEPLIAPKLNEDQRAVWRTFQKAEFGWFPGVVGFHARDSTDDNWWNGEPEKPDADVKKK
jgi:hypothetical protein